MEALPKQDVEVIDPMELLLNTGPKKRKKKVMGEWFEGCTTCKECGKTFATKSALDVHYRTHTGEKPYQCKLCLKAFTQKAHIKRHALVHHNEAKVQGTPLSFNCDQCPRVFRDPRAFQRHKNMHFGFDLRFSCDQCDKSYSRVANLTAHMVVHTAGYDCKICNENFPTFVELRRHRAIFHKKPPLKCEICDKTFAHQCDLKIHNRKHSEERPYSCELCGKLFKSVSHVNRHLRTHKDYVPVFKSKYTPCVKCGAGFNTQIEVVLHKCSYLDPLFPFSCAFCDNGYVNKKELRQHIRLDHLQI